MFQKLYSFYLLTILELVDATANNLHEQLVAGISSIRKKSRFNFE